MPITYDDKDKTLPTSNPRRLVRDVDMNEIKNVVNANETATAAAQSNVDSHEALTNNPHSVTKSQVGLSDVENLSIAARLLTANIVKRETPGGAINGSNTAFTVAFPLIAGSEELFRNGILQDITTSYTISGQNITMIVAPETGDSLKINYIKS